MELSKDDFEFFETAMTDQEAANILRNMIKNYTKNSKESLKAVYL